MTDKARPWLPAGAVFSPAAQTRLKDVVAGWSNEWFGSRDLYLGKRGLGAGGDVGGEARHAFESPLIKVRVLDASHRLASWALDAPIERLSLNDEDLTLILAFERALLDDLAGRLTALLQQAGAVTGEASDATDFDLWVEARDDHAPILISIPRSVMMSFSKSLLPAASRKPGIETRIQALFGEAAVNVRAGVGWTQTPVSDLRRLAVGDVLVLDRRVSQDVLIYMADSNAPVGTATLTSHPSELLVSRTAGQNP